LPATAHGLQGRFNARTVTKRKYPGSAPVPVEPALPHLWHGPVRSLSFYKDCILWNPRSWRVCHTARSPSYPGVFLFDFQSAWGLSEPRAIV